MPMEITCCRALAAGAGMTTGPGGIYITRPESCAVERFSPSLEPLGTTRLALRLSLIAYDRAEDCFWGYLAGTPSALYRLDSGLAMAGQIELSLPDSCADIVSLAVDCSSGLIVAATQSAVLTFRRDGSYAGRLLRAAAGAQLSAALPMPPWLIVRYRRGGRAYMALVAKGGEVLSETALRGRCQAALAVDVGSAASPAFFVHAGGQLQTWSLGRGADACSFEPPAPPPGPCPPPCEGVAGSCQAVIRSVAEMESALSRLLCSPMPSMEVVAQVAELEGLLLEKLRTVQNILSETDCC